MAYTVTTKQFLRMLLFSTGIGFLMWQIKGTFLTFIESRTTFSVSKETSDSMVLPTLIFCPIVEWDNGLNNHEAKDIEDRDCFRQQFFLINDKLTLKLGTDGNLMHTRQLSLGQNLDEKGKPLVTVEEFMYPIVGLCYALTPNQNRKIGMNEFWTLIANFTDTAKLPMANIIFTKPEDRYGYLLPDRGRQMNLEFSVVGGSWQNTDLEKMVWNFLPAKRNCQHYNTEDSYVKCILKKQMNCYRLNAVKRGCRCIPENNFKTHFDMFNFDLDTCKNHSEDQLCWMTLTKDCYYDKLVTQPNWCRHPCQKEVYFGNKWKNGGFGFITKSNPNSMIVNYKYNSMDTEVHDEVWIQDEFNFIGTVGGSFGLFIGFSYTGFGSMILDYFMRE